MHIRNIFFIAAVCVILAGCGGKELAPHNPMGLSGKLNAEAEASFARAHVLWDKRDVCSDPPLAVGLLDKAIALEPGYAEAYLRRGLAKSDMKDWDGAFDDLTKAIRLNPSAEAFAFRGLVSMRGGNHMGARKDFDRSLAITKRQHRAWNFRGALNRLEGFQEAACADFAEGCDYGDCIGLETSIKMGECPP
ncbi:Tetratricopeptide repeat family protein [uncultured delta proteobacterium]|uniref:Tetratricopeptide repeat family protein n=1 Tax=uncultured delta proteobacterium TaxID=34034 RepID=A0A212KBH3_9DELT|nr:Tetratricopeptide repeat family protein [uncultured delta proteobacterium]